MVKITVPKKSLRHFCQPAIFLTLSTSASAARKQLKHPSPKEFYYAEQAIST